MVKESDLKKEELYDKGIYAYKNNNYEEALNLFNEAIVCDGKFYKAKIAKVDCLYKMGRLNEVHPICTEIFSSDCLDEEVWYKLGDFYYNVGRMFENALDCFNKAIELKEDYADAWDMKGSALSFMANFEEALNSHNKAAELNPDNPNIYDNIGYCYASLGMFDNALEAYDKALEIDSQDINALSNKASILNNMGKSEEALNYIKRALEIKEDYNLLYYKAVALFTLEKYEDSAKQLAEKAAAEAESALAARARVEAAVREAEATAAQNAAKLAEPVSDPDTYRRHYVMLLSVQQDVPRGRIPAVECTGQHACHAG